MSDREIPEGEVPMYLGETKRLVSSFCLLTLPDASGCLNTSQTVPGKQTIGDGEKTMTEYWKVVSGTSTLR